MVLSAYDHENWFLKNKKRRRETVVSWVGGGLVSICHPYVTIRGGTENE